MDSQEQAPARGSDEGTREAKHGGPVPQDANRWISTDERLPHNKTPVWVTLLYLSDRSRELACCYRLSTGDWFENRTCQKIPSHIKVIFWAEAEYPGQPNRYVA